MRCKPVNAHIKTLCSKLFNLLSKYTRFVNLSLSFFLFPSYLIINHQFFQFVRGFNAETKHVFEELRKVGDCHKHQLNVFSAFPINK